MTTPPNNLRTSELSVKSKPFLAPISHHINSSRLYLAQHRTKCLFALLPQEITCSIFELVLEDILEKVAFRMSETLMSRLQDAENGILVGIDAPFELGLAVRSLMRKKLHEQRMTAMGRGMCS